MMTCNTLQHLQKIWLFCLCHAWNSLMPSICLMENFLRCPWWIWNAFTAAVKCRVSTYTQGQMRQTQSKLSDPIWSLQFVLEQTEDEGGGGRGGYPFALVFLAHRCHSGLNINSRPQSWKEVFHIICALAGCVISEGGRMTGSRSGVFTVLRFEEETVILDC